jgi:hypothetical protein
MRRAPLAAPERRLRPFDPRAASWRSLVALLVTLQLAACVSRGTPQRTLRAGYATPLVEVVGSAEGTTASTPGAELLGDSLRYRYADSVVEIRTSMLADRVALAILNRTDEPLTIVWDEARYTDFDGETTTVSHASGRRGKRQSEPSTVIPPRRSFVGAVRPDSRVVHYPGSEGPFGWKPGGWGNAPLLTVWTATVTGEPGSPDVERQREAFLADVKEMMGKRIGVMIPVRSGGGARDYTLWFAVRGAAVIDE